MPLEQRTAPRGPTARARPAAAPTGRRDAQRNRQLLVAAAEEVLRRDGLGAPLDAIARRAGVGNATLYRHFPTREALYDAVFTEAAARWEPVRERILAIPDPWAGLAGYVELSCQFIAADRMLVELCHQQKMSPPRIVEMGERDDRDLATLLERAQAAGVARPELEVTDLRLLLMSLHQVTLAVGAVSPDGWRRHLALILSSLRPDATPLPPGTLTSDDLWQIARNVSSCAQPS